MTDDEEIAREVWAVLRSADDLRLTMRIPTPPPRKIVRRIYQQLRVLPMEQITPFESPPFACREYELVRSVKDASGARMFLYQEKLP